MVLDPNNTVQPEMTFTLNHKRAIYDEATCTCVLIHSRDRIFFFFESGKILTRWARATKEVLMQALITKFYKQCKIKGKQELCL